FIMFKATLRRPSNMNLTRIKIIILIILPLLVTNLYIYMIIDVNPWIKKLALTVDLLYFRKVS
ncbi:hypothetical protein, partial [Caldivirga sp. UBA161]|uniref:hypothetical protein n=1 Tax=Caldivirga sp. UBA161 TaxID=1915569 RepID=UPI0025B94B43